MIIAQGRVMGGNRKPTKIEKTRENGEKYWFCYFYVSEQYGRNEEGPMYRSIQVVLPDKEENHKVFYHLEPGREVLVTGQSDANPRSVFNEKTQKFIAYANPIIRCSSSGVQLIGNSFPRTASNVISFFLKREWMTEEQADELRNRSNSYFSEEREPPRNIIYLKENNPQQNQEDQQNPGF